MTQCHVVRHRSTKLHGREHQFVLAYMKYAYKRITQSSHISMSFQSEGAVCMIILTCSETVARVFHGLCRSAVSGDLRKRL